MTVIEKQCYDCKSNDVQTHMIGLSGQPYDKCNKCGSKNVGPFVKTSNPNEQS